MVNDMQQADWNGLIPPIEMIKAVGSTSIVNFKDIGRRFLCHFKDLGNLQPTERVLDVGCGCGRIARWLTRYLDEEVMYKGFDVDCGMVKWCKENYSRYPSFSFEHADVYSREFNPRGKCKASGYKFQYDDEFFDFVFLTSVFTHMFPEGVSNYFSEIARVLKPSGRCLITFFLINAESRRHIEEKSSDKDFDKHFRDSGKGYWTTNRDNPEKGVAYPEECIRSCFEKHQLKMTGRIHYGDWCGRESLLDYQDVVVATKRDSPRHIGGFPRVE